MRTNFYLKLKASILLICFFVCGVLSVDAKPKVVTVSTYNADLNAIGTPDSLMSLASFADGKVWIKVYHNADGVKIQLIANDEMTQQKLLMNGLTVYIDPTGKEKDKYAVIFPSAMSLMKQRMQAGGLMQPPGQGGEPMPGMIPGQGQAPGLDGTQGQPNANQDPRRRKPDPSGIAQQMNMKGAMFDVDGDSRFAGISLAKLTITDTKQICYNITLPYSIFEIKNLAPAFVGIGVLSEYVQMQMPEGAPGGGMGGPPGGGMGGSPGGGMGGGSGGMGGGPGGGMGGPGGGMGGPPGGGMGGASRQGGSKDSTSSEMKKAVKGWIQAKLEMEATVNQK